MKVETLALFRQYIAAIEDLAKEFPFYRGAHEIIEIGRKLDVAIAEEELRILLDLARQYFNKGDRVKVCSNPRCAHHADATGVIDIVGIFDGDEEVGITVLVDGGGICGPYRVNELTKL